MANWCNLRLVVTGLARDLMPFRRAAGALRGRIDTRRSQVFTAEMEFGEGGDLEADGIRAFDKEFRRASFRFQGMNDAHAEHFRTVSRRFPRLAFVLVVSDPNADWHGSYLMRNGRSRFWSVPRRVEERVLTERYRSYGLVGQDGEVDYDSDYADVAEWESFMDLMDVAEGKWRDEVLSWVKAAARVGTSAPRRTEKKRSSARV